MPGILFVLATPIGNLSDITLRALETLKLVSAIICEDTRITRHLLAHFNISKELISLHEHSSAEKINSVLQRVMADESLAYVTDAGTPGLADPGGKLVQAATLQGITVVPIPGVSALTTAVQIAGLNLQEFVFMGWPPHKKGRVTWFKDIVASPRPVIFFESTHRIIKALQQLQQIAPERTLVVCRELTKKFETIYRGLPEEVIKQLSETSTKGEFVIILNHV